MKRRKEQVKAYAKALIQNNFDRGKAMQQISPNISKKSRIVKTTRWSKAKEVQEAILKEIKQFDKGIITEEYLYYYIDQLVRDSKTRDSTKAMLLSLVAKLLNLASDSQNINIIQGEAINTRLKRLLG